MNTEKLNLDEEKSNVNLDQVQGGLFSTITKFKLPKFGILCQYGGGSVNSKGVTTVSTTAATTASKNTQAF
jgi:hypothetical protein